jgi:tRNA isopentenyl-2-thiomethyl-A-37 hydroxylase MiaE
MEIVNLQLEPLIVKLKYALMLQQQLILMLIVLHIKRDASQQEKGALLQLYFLNVQLIKEIVQLVLDILGQMVYVKEMLEVHNVEQENVKTEHSQQMLIVVNINTDAKQQEKHALLLSVFAQAIKEHKLLALVI